MIKKLPLLASFLLLFAVTKAQKNPFYYELISNDSKTINFVFGFYPSTYKYVESKDADSYTTFKSAVINNSKEKLKWNNYKINILTKAGKLIRSYTTVAETGDYACEYKVDASETHYQYFCFHQKITNDDIDKVWLVLGDDQIFNLLYDKNE